VELDDVRSQLRVSLMENRKLQADLDNLVTKVLQVPLALILLAVPDVPDLLPSFIPVSPMILTLC
jgi:hypothetical protein